MNVYLIIILSIIIGDYILNITADKLNLQHFKTELPEEFNSFYDSEKYSQSQKYLRENTQFELVSDTFFTSVVVGFILLGGFNIFDQYARSFGFSNIFTGLIFAGTLLLASNIIHIPFSTYHTFVIEEKYGFNRTTIKTFIADILKGWLLAAVLGGLIFFIVLWCFNKIGAMAWVYCWAAVTLFQLLITFVAPVLIMPLFNKFIPLKDGDLKSAIKDYATSQNFKIKGVFTMDGSKRSSKSNAFFTGFGKFRRIVLFDTLIEKHSAEELVSILAHEIGHYKKKHILKHLIISIITTGLMFFMLSFFINNRDLFAAFKMEETSIYASFLFFGFLYAPVSMIISILSNMFSRKNEYEADEYAVATYQKPESMVQALKKLSVDNMSNLTPHPFKVFLSYSHPPVLDRIIKIKQKEIP